MLYSVLGLAVLEKKKPPSLAVCLDLRRTVPESRVNLPLLHRQGAGMAKVKIAGKENVLAHEKSGMIWRPCSLDYNAIV
ncbi:hypothetical protein IM543_06705 [Massilia sp. UMI-21]|nr:hypothetical protein IM543_06705 [Massilia sp. UMI-21]